MMILAFLVVVATLGVPPVSSPSRSDGEGDREAVEGFSGRFRG